MEVCGQVNLELVGDVSPSPIRGKMRDKGHPMKDKHVREEPRNVANNCPRSSRNDKATAEQTVWDTHRKRTEDERRWGGQRKGRLWSWPHRIWRYPVRRASQAQQPGRLKAIKAKGCPQKLLLLWPQPANSSQKNFLVEPGTGGKNNSLAS